MKRLFLNYYLFIILLLLLAKFVAVPLIEHLAAAPFKREFVQYYQELTKGSFFTLSQYLQGFSQEQWSNKLQLLQPQFGYPIGLTAIDQKLFSEEEIIQLLAGQVVVGGQYDQFWQRIGQSEYALAMGPFPSPGVGGAVNVVIWGVVLLLLGVVVLLWALPLWKQLARISKSAETFGDGNLDVRAMVPRQSMLAPLANTFNQMAERIEQLITSQKMLTNAVSHELRTPIARIQFGVEMVANTSESSKREQYLKGVHRDIGALESLVSELLVYARFDSKNFELQKEIQTVAPWFKKIISDLRNQVSARIRYTTPDEKRMVATFDSRMLQRALGNLIQNAAKYGNGQVEVAVEKEEGGLLIHVDDDGPSIPVDERERVFEPFSRLDSSRNRQSGGYGLGLAIVKQVMVSHGGTVGIADSPLGGSRFTLYLPDNGR